MVPTPWLNGGPITLANDITDRRRFLSAKCVAPVGVNGPDEMDAKTVQRRGTFHRTAWLGRRLLLRGRARRCRLRRRSLAVPLALAPEPVSNLEKRGRSVVVPLRTLDDNSVYDGPSTRGYGQLVAAVDALTNSIDGSAADCARSNPGRRHASLSRILFKSEVIRLRCQRRAPPPL